MKNIKVLGTGCANCNTTYTMLEETAKSLGVAIQLEKIEELGAIMAYGVMSTPAVVIDEQLVHAGGLPSRATVEGWLADEGGCSGSQSGCC
ncbi:thioredoxin family protein [Ectothiorhodospiraceae bacterium BW-2]|nr:thioredoxin family protein [Ectothiorhodospiraceae bacterium BW-2]